MRLVNWNSEMNLGRGRSGSTYAIACQDRALPELAQAWIVSVDDRNVCSTGTPLEAVEQIERLEALRCVMRGLAGEMSERELGMAGLIAAEMSRAAAEALADRNLSRAQAAEIERSIAQLRSLEDVILRRQGLASGDEDDDFVSRH
jgi:uncharacterized protein with von Willebrand factor type A (vWA) domain